MPDINAVREWALKAQAKHKEILDVLGRVPQPWSSDFMREMEGELNGLEYEYTHGAGGLPYFNNILPMNMDPTNPEHALFLATRNDILESARRLNALRNNRSQQKAWDKFETAVRDIPIVGGGVGKPRLPDLGLPDLGVGGWLAVGGLLLTLLMFMRGDSD